MEQNCDVQLIDESDVQLKDENDVQLKDENEIKLKLKSFTGKVMTISLSAAKMSSMIKNMLETTGDEKKDLDKPIELLNDAITDAALEKIIEWCEYHCNDSPVDEDFDSERDRRNGELSQWDKRFIDVKDWAHFYDIVVGANYMDIKGLVDVGGKHICNQIKGKTSEEVRQILGIENDFTEDEEKEIKAKIAAIYD